MAFFQCRKSIVVFAAVFLVSVSFGGGFGNCAYAADIKPIFKTSSRQSAEAMASGKLFSALNPIFGQLLDDKNPHIMNNSPSFEASKPFKAFNQSKPYNSYNPYKPYNSSKPFKPSNPPKASKQYNSPKVPKPSNPASTPNQPSAPEKPSANNGTSSSNPSAFSTYEQEAVNLLNADRAANELPALKVNMTLVRLAGDYAQDMIERGFFAHENPEGLSPFDRMKNAGVSYRWAGENIAINSSVEAAQKAFMASAGHRANILNPNFTHVGIGVKRDARGSFYVVQEFIGV